MQTFKPQTQCSALNVLAKKTHKTFIKNVEYLLKIHNEFVRCDLLVFDYYNGTETKENKNCKKHKMHNPMHWNVTGN